MSCCAMPPAGSLRSAPADGTTFDKMVSVELVLELADALVHELGASRCGGEFFLQQALRRSNRGVDCNSAHVGNRLRLGTRNLFLRELRASLEHLVQVLARLRCERLRLFARLLDDALGLLLRGFPLVLIIGKQRLRILAEP